MEEVTGSSPVVSTILLFTMRDGGAESWDSKPIFADLWGGKALRATESADPCGHGGSTPPPGTSKFYDTKRQRKNMELAALRHSTSHVMAQAVKSLWPDAKLGIGPSIEDGFYYDFGKEEPFAPEDLELIENRMREIIKKNYKFEKKDIKKTEAVKLFKKMKEKYLPGRRFRGFMPRPSYRIDWPDKSL